MDEPKRQDLALADAFGAAETHPLHQMLARVADTIDLETELEDWARQNPASFTRMLLTLVPNAAQQMSANRAPARSEGNNFNIHLHPSLAAGPLDVKDVIEHDDPD